MYFPTEEKDEAADAGDDSGYSAPVADAEVDVLQWLSEDPGHGNTQVLENSSVDSPIPSNDSPRTSRLGRVSYKERTAVIVGSPNQVEMDVNGVKASFTSVDKWMEEVDHMVDTDDLD